MSLTFDVAVVWGLRIFPIGCHFVSLGNIRTGICVSLGNTMRGQASFPGKTFFGWWFQNVVLRVVRYFKSVVVTEGKSSEIASKNASL